MTKAKSPDALRARADALFRTADEWAHQRERCRRLAAAGALPAEEEVALKAVKLYDKLIVSLVAEYEAAAGAAHVAADESWRRAANTLWHAVREYSRRDAACADTSARVSGAHTIVQLGNITMENELAASALMALRQALDGYRKEMVPHEEPVGAKR